MKNDRWEEIVKLMRLNAAGLAATPGQEPRLVRRVTSSFDALASQHRRAWGLNHHEMQAILILWEFGRMTMTDLGSRIPLSRAAVTTLTDRLESLGLVKRNPDPTDRRRVLLEITPRVETEMARVNSGWDEHVHAIAAADPAAWESFVQVALALRDSARSEAEYLRALDDDAFRTKGAPVKRRAAEDENPSWW